MKRATEIFSFPGNRYLQILVFFLVFNTGCKKGEDVISGNVPPPDQTIEDVSISNYVNRVYISVLGREADSTEKANAFSTLRSANLSMSSRQQFLDVVFTRAEYKDHLYTLARIDLLNNLDTADIKNWIAIFQTLLLDTAYAAVWGQVNMQIARLDSMEIIPGDLHSNTINVTYLHRRCVNNYFYDQINMGTENFVVSCFQHFLNRYPSDYELVQSKKMVDGQTGSLFLQSGQSKDDFLRIFFTSSNYYEGLAINLYRRFLFRSPSSTEMSAATQSFAQSQNYEEMQKNILSTNDYIFQ